MPTLLIEIGSEELPASYIQPALDSFAEKLCHQLRSHRISYGKCVTMGTPRRLAIRLEDVAAKQEPVTETVLGPPEEHAFNEKGEPTIAALKFSEKAGSSVAALETTTTPKGTYLCVTRTKKGMTTSALLKTLIPPIVKAVPFPKTMKWAGYHLNFARPVHSLVVLLGEKLVPVTVGPIKSRRLTQGHFFMSPTRVKLANADDYEDRLRQVGVIADFQKRRQAVSDEIERVVKSCGGHILPDEELLDIVTNLVEKPFPVIGKFDDEFLALPREVLITAMREHQKYFAVADGSNRLLPYFVAVNNSKATDMAVVATGHQRVIRARLSDAKFFYESDLKVPLDRMVEQLKSVLFQADLGSMYAKTVRNQEIARFLARAVGSSRRLPAAGQHQLEEQCARAAYLCKADLVSQMVGEFAKLQGVMGRIYAQKANEKGDIPQAIEDHYRPVYSGAPLAQTLVGALVGISDKIDAICGCFTVGLKPTGGADPYALRRQGIGILQTMVAQEIAVPLNEIIQKALSQFDGASEKPELADEVYGFLKQRMAQRLVDDGFSKDVVAAVTAVKVGQVAQVWERAKAVQEFKKDKDFDVLAATFKRVANIIKKNSVPQNGAIDETLFEGPVEKTLFKAYLKVADRVDLHVGRGEYTQSLSTIASLRPEVDLFFDKVMVMAEDQAIRQNRLLLLKKISDLFIRIADIGRMAGAASDR